MGDWVMQPSAVLSILLLLNGLSVSAALPADKVLRSVADVRDLTAMERLGGHPVVLEGIVLARFPDRGRLFVHDSGRGVVVLPPRGGQKPAYGVRVRVEGTTTVNLKSHIQATNIVVLAENAIIPTAEAIGVDELLERVPYEGWFEVAGFVLSARNVRFGLQLQVRADGQTLTVMGPPAAAEELTELVFARVQLTGVLAVAGVSGSPEVGQRLLWVDEPSNIHLLEPWPGDPFDLRLVTAADLAKLKDQAAADQPCRMRLRVVENEEGESWYRAADATGEVYLTGLGVGMAESGEVMDVLGLPDRTRGDGLVGLRVTQIRWLGQRGDRPEPDAPLDLKKWEPCIANMSGFRALTPAQWMERLPARVFGQVSYRDEAGGRFHLQMGASAGVMARMETDGGEIPTRGERLQAIGFTDVDRDGPVLTVKRFRSLRMVELPEPRRPSVDSFLAGRLTGAWMSMDGVVRSVSTRDRSVELRCEWQNEIITALLKMRRAMLPTNLVDSVVRLVGVAGVISDPLAVGGRRPVLRVAEADDVEMLDAATVDSDDTTVLPIREIVEGVWSSSGQRRVRVRGMVTSVRQGRVTVDDGIHAVLVRFSDKPSVVAGDAVEVLGFPTPAIGGARLTDAVIQRTGSGTLPEPEAIGGGGLNDVALHHRRVRLSGALSGQTPGPQGYTLVVRGAVGTFTAGLPVGIEKDSRWKNGSIIEVTGVARLEHGADGALESFHVLLPGPKAVTVLVAAPWWTMERAMVVAVGLGMLALLATAWAVYLRRRADISRRQFLATFEASPLPAWIVNQRTNRLIAVNQQYVCLFGYARDEVVGRTTDDFNLWASLRKRRRFAEHVRTHDRVTAYEARLRTSAGQTIQALLSVEPLVVGEDDCRLIIAFDVTERLKLLEQLRHAQKMEAVGQLAAGVAHDFNNLLTIILGNAALIRTAGSLEDIRGLNEEVDQTAKRAADLTGRLLAFSRRQEMQRRALELRKIVDNAAAMVSRVVGKRVTLTIRHGAEPLPIWADSSMLDQVILNLAVNARDAMPDGGHLLFTTGRTVVLPEELTDHPDAMAGDYAVMSVTDTGQGMTEEVRQQAFEPFYTTKEPGQGTGLGLATIQGIVNQHNGWIDLETAPGRGTTFSIHLPITTGEPDSDSGDFDSLGVGSGRETILVADDETSLRTMVVRSLTRQGYTVLDAGDGPDAEALWIKHGSRVDLLLTDIVMPNGMTGIELAKKLQADRPELKVIFMTGYSNELVEHGGTLTAGLDFLAKPFDQGELIKTVRRRLDADASNERTAASWQAGDFSQG